MKHIYFLRHAQSQGNVENRVLGQTDMPLSERGMKQANDIVKSLCQYNFDEIYCSDLTRTKQTIQPYLEYTSKSVTYTSQLEEFYFGDCEGILKEDMKAQYLDTYRVFMQDFGNYKAPNGESTFECGKRIFDFVMNIVNSSNHQSFLIVSHAAAIRSFDCYVRNCYLSDQIRPFPLNATLSYYTWDDNKLQNVFYSLNLQEK